MERNWEKQVKLVSPLKEGTTSRSLGTPMVKTKQTKNVFVVDIEGTFLDEPKENIYALTSFELDLSILPLCPCYLGGISFFRAFGRF